MKLQRIVGRTAAAILTVLAVVASPVSMARASQVILLDTSSLAGQVGYLDFEFNPEFSLDGSLPPPASATVSGFTNDGTIDPTTATSFGNISGDVSSPADSLTLYNNDGGDPPNISEYTDYNVGFTFGNTISFDLDFAGGAGSATTTGSAFTLTFYASDNATPLLGLNSDGTNSAVSVTIDPNADGATTTITTYVNPQVAPASVPEPASLLMLSTGILVMTAGATCARRCR